MTQLAAQLNKKLETWNPKVVGQAKQLVDDVITMPSTNALDLLPSRLAVLKVLDLLDERYARENLAHPQTSSHKSKPRFGFYSTCKSQ